MDFRSLKEYESQTEASPLAGEVAERSEVGGGLCEIPLIGTKIAAIYPLSLASLDSSPARGEPNGVI